LRNEDEERFVSSREDVDPTARGVGALRSVIEGGGFRTLKRGNSSGPKPCSMCFGGLCEKREATRGKEYSCLAKRRREKDRNLKPRGIEPCRGGVSRLRDGQKDLQRDVLKPRKAKGNQERWDQSRETWAWTEEVQKTWSPSPNRESGNMKKGWHWDHSRMWV